MDINNDQHVTVIYQVLQSSERLYLPMQFLDPALNGIKAYGDLLADTSGENLFGSYLSGSGKAAGSLCRTETKTVTEPASLGIVYPAPGI